jgi:Acylphosphatases
LITGEPDLLDLFIEWCKRGPEKARVKEVLVSKHPEKEFDDFEIVR